MKTRILRIFIFLIIGMGIGFLILSQTQKSLDEGVIELSPDAAKDKEGNAKIIKEKSTIRNGKMDMGDDFELINQNGEAVTLKTYDGSYKLIFFGFTYCPAICPTELQKITQIMEKLGDKANMFTPIFISVDPERDTVDVVKQYVAQFHPKLVGLTGSTEQVNAVTKSFKVFATKVENDMMEEYMVDHSAFLYLLDEEGNTIALYPSTDTADELVTDILSRLE